MLTKKAAKINVLEQLEVHMTKKNPYIQDHPPPVFIREKIQDDILNYNTDIRMQCEAGQISAQQLQAQMDQLVNQQASEQAQMEAQMTKQLASDEEARIS